MAVFPFHGLEADVREALVPLVSNKLGLTFHAARIEQAIFGAWSRQVGDLPGLGQYHGPERSRDGNAVLLLDRAIDMLADFAKRPRAIFVAINQR